MGEVAQVQPLSHCSQMELDRALGFQARLLSVPSSQLRPCCEAGGRAPGPAGSTLRPVSGPGQEARKHCEMVSEATASSQLPQHPGIGNQEI